MKHKESDLQIRCIKWFRYQYPAYARLLEHPKNEGCGNRRQGAIAKAEGVQPGVADLILHVPAYPYFHSLAIEMKTLTGRQSTEQKQWQRYFEAAGGQYVVVRSYEEFVKNVNNYFECVPQYIKEAVKLVYDDIQRQAEEEARAQLSKIINH